MALTYSAGVVTAYGAAKKAGYTGTYEQFCQDQANFATNATQVATDKTTVEGWMTTLREYKESAEASANAAQSYAASASESFHTDLLAQNYDARSRYDTGQYVIQSGAMYRCTVPITVPERWDDQHWENHWARVTVGSELISALEEVVAKHFNRNKTYVAGDYVIYDNMLYRCIAATKPGYAWNSDQWLHVTYASEFQDRVTELEQSFAFPNNKNLVNPAVQQVYQGSVFSGYSQYYVSAYIPFKPNVSYILRTIDGPGDFVYEIFDKEKASLTEQIQILATDVSNDMIIRTDEPDAALIRIISPLDLSNVCLTESTNGTDFIKFNLKSSAYISTIMEQDLTDAQKEMVQRNLGIDNISQMISGVVKYDTDQELTEEQKKKAQDNIGVSDAIQDILDSMPSESDLTGAVRYDGPQDPALDDNQKQQARTNIGAIGESEISGFNDRIGDLEGEVSEFSGAVKKVSKIDSGLKVEYFDGDPSTIELAESEKLHLYYDPTENYLYLQNDADETQGSPVYIAGGGGGGGSTVAATVKVERLDANNQPTNVSTMDIVSGDSAILRYRLKVVEAGEGGEEIAGTATARWYNNSIFLTSTSVVHNTPESFDITPYLQPGTNNISVAVNASVGGDITMPASRGWTVKLVDLYFNWPFETSRINTRAFTDSYTVYGDVEKYMHLAIDGETDEHGDYIDDDAHSPYPGGKKIEGSGRETKETIPVLSHGVHRLTRWLTATVNGVPVPPKYKTVETIFFDETKTEAVVSADTSDFTMDQYSTKKIMFIVADPTDLTVSARILVDGVVKATYDDLDRSQHPWNYTAMESGYKEIRIEALKKVGQEYIVSAFKEFHATISPVSMNVQETPDYIFKLKASELGSNNDLKNWTNDSATNPVSLSFSENFDWVNGGLQYETDDSGNIRQYICVKAGTQMTVKHKLFLTEAKDTGLNFKIAFKVANVQDYDSVWGQCLYNGRGLELRAHDASIISGTTVATLYEEESYVEYELEIYKRDQDATHAAAPHNYVMAWLDGVLSNIAIYDGESDSFQHPNSSAPFITIGSQTSDVYVYLMKTYQHSIDYQEHVDNFIMDAPTGEEMVRRYQRNDIMNSVTNEIDYQMLAEKNKDLRIYLYDIPYMTMDKIKKDPVANCKFQQIWRNGGEEYQLQGTCTMGIQGTSSFNYRRGAANTDSRFDELTYTKGGQVVDLLEDGVYLKDDVYGDNWYTKDPNDPETAKIYTKEEAYVEAKLRKTYTVKEAKSQAQLQEGQELDPNEWIVWETNANEEPVRYIRASEAAAAYEKSLGPEWIVRYRDENRNATHYVRALGFKINDTSCPITYSNIKVNYASCEQVNNYCNAMWYQKFQPFPSRTARDCMEFSMGVQFVKDRGEIPNDGKHMYLFTKPQVDANGNVVMVDGKPNYVQEDANAYHMYSIANMGTSKNNVHVFHDISNINEVCVEVKDNTMLQCRFKDYSDDPIDWGGDGAPFELRYPSTKKPAQVNAGIEPAWKRFWKWQNDNDPTAATNQPLSAPETYGEYTFRGHHRAVPANQNNELTNFAQVLRGTKVTQYKGTYTADTFERRMAKMLSECEDYMCMDSVIYHFLFIERHTAMDNVAKNTFWSTDDLVHWDLSKAYDMDTSDGNNNEGVMSFDYGNEWDDDVFNADTSVWFVFAANLYEACKTMFINREALGAWNYRTYHNFLKTEQDKVPERCWVQCYYYDYIRTYERQLAEVNEKYTYLACGKKTHQREHYEKFQELYMSGKYNGSAAASSVIGFRGYEPATYAPTVPPNPKVRLRMYNKMYATVDVDGRPFTRKFEKGETEFIDFSHLHLDDTVIKVYPANMVQEISNLESIYGGDYSFGAATKLKTLKLGSTAPGYRNDNFFNLSLSNNPMLETLEVQNLVNGTKHVVGNLDLSKCPSLVSVDATGSDFTGVTLANNGLINSVKLKAPTALVLPNLRYLTDANLIISDYSKIYRLGIENCEGIDALTLIKTILNARDNSLSQARLIGMIWNAGLNAEVLAALYAMSGWDETGYSTTHAVLAGEGSLLTLTRRLQNMYDAAWPNFDLRVIAPTEERIITFINEDGTPVRDKNGDPYFQYIEEGQSAYDPISAGEINTPTMADTAEYTATFSYFANLDGIVYTDKTVTAMYTKKINEYRVTWYTDPLGNALYSKTVPYGSEAVYDYDGLGCPVKGLSGGDYSVFDGWKQSTGRITGPTSVYARWITHRGQVVKRNTNGPQDAAYVELKDMSPAQISAALAQGGADEYWEIKDYVDIEVGADFDFENVDSQVIVGKGGMYEKDLYLNGGRVYNTNLRLFAEDTPSFTLAIDYEFTSETTGRTLIACYDTNNGNGGFQLAFQSGTTSPTFSWGDQTTAIGNYGMKRGMLVLVHEKGSKTITVCSNNVTTRYLDSVYSTSVTRSTDFVSGNATLTLGGLLSTGGSLANMAQGTIHWCKIWWDTLGNTVTRQLANWPHETWRMHYAGTGFYPKQKDGLYCNATFIANTPLRDVHPMNTTNDSSNQYGYSISELKVFMDGGTVNGVKYSSRVYEALPYSWKALIQTVTLTEQQFYTNNVARTTTFPARVHIPAYRAYSEWSNDSYGYNQEDKQIPWYTTSSGIQNLEATQSSVTDRNYNRRELFPGWILDENTRRYLARQDISTSSALPEPLKDGDIWHNYNTNSSVYMYISNDTLQKLGWIAGRNKNTDNQNIIFQTNSGTGVWVLRSDVPVTTRSHYYTTGYYFWVYSASGYLTYGWSYSSNMLLYPMFSI